MLTTQYRKMKKILLVFLLAVSLLTASSQKVYFIYLQSETDQPFFVKMSDKIYSSTSSGYLILSKLYDTIYNLKIGFPQNKWPEQDFSVPVNHKDHGYLLKDFGEKGWGLFDLQSLTVQMSAISATKGIEKSKISNKEVSDFTEILAKASDDPSLKEKPAIQKTEDIKVSKIEPKKVESEAEVVKQEDPKIENKEIVVAKTTEEQNQAAKVEKKEELKPVLKEAEVPKQVESISLKEVKPETKEPIVIPVQKKLEETEVKKEDPKSIINEQAPVVTKIAKDLIEDTYIKSVITKRSESSTTEGFGLVFIDNYENGTRDTIRLLIPNPKVVTIDLKEEPKEEKKFLDITTDASPKQEEKPVEQKPKFEEKPAPAEKQMEKPILPVNCPSVADENDFFTLRKTMAAAEGDDDMVAQAKKYFKLKCFSTAQLKNLSTLFLNDEAKYTFFDVAYKYVADKGEFGSLQTELKDEYFINRFKAMIR